MHYQQLTLDIVAVCSSAGQRNPGSPGSRPDWEVSRTSPPEALLCRGSGLLGFQLIVLGLPGDWSRFQSWVDADLQLHTGQYQHAFRASCVRALHVGVGIGMWVNCLWMSKLPGAGLDLPDLGISAQTP